MNTEETLLPVEVSELAVKVSANKQKEVAKVLQQIFTGTDDWEKQVDAIEVKDINDKMSIELAEVARKNSKQARLSAEKIFDAKREEVQNLKAEFDLEDKLWLKAKQVMQIKFKAIEEKAEWKANFVKRFEAEQKELRTQKRINEVSKYAEINRIEFEAMSDESFESFLSGLKSTYEAKIEAELKAEEERISKEKADAEAREQQRLENERLKAEAEKREQEIELERKKQREEAERFAKIRDVRAKQLQPFIVFIRDYNSLINKPESDYQSELLEIKKVAELQWEFEASERIRINKENEEREAKLKEEQQAKAKLEAELKAQKDAKLKAELEKLEVDKKAKLEADKLAKAPMKHKLTVWVDSFEINRTYLEDSDTKQNIIAKFEAFKNWAKTEIEKL